MNVDVERVEFSLKYLTISENYGMLIRERR